MTQQIEYKFEDLVIGARFCIVGNSCVFHKTSEDTAQGGIFRITHNFSKDFPVVRAPSMGTITEVKFLKVQK